MQESSRGLKIIVAPNALKGSLSATAAAQAMTAGVHLAAPAAEVVQIPVADGGDGLLEVLGGSLDLQRIPCNVTGPLGKPVAAAFLYSAGSHLAIIEMATAAGLALLPASGLDPMQATTFGVGELLRLAMDHGAEHIILGIGGSATSDGGTGLARALGARFLDARGNELAGIAAALPNIKHIDLEQLDPRLAQTRIDVICDVDNPLLGEHGAARVFAPQKGANPAQVVMIEAGLDNLASLVEQQLGLDIRQLRGGGAAGGLGAGLVAFLQAELRPGAALVLELTGFETALDGASLVLTAEGSLDSQTTHGKAPAEVARLASRHGIPCIAIAGSLGADLKALQVAGITACFSLCPGPLSLDVAMQQAAQLLTAACEQAVRCFFAGNPAGLNHEPLTDGNPMIKKCLFPAAGYGTRFLPATKAMPKEMLPVLDKPLIQYGVEEAMDAGMKNIAIITGRGKRAIEDHFDISYELEHQISGTAKEAQLQSIRKIIDECTFSYTRQIEMQGLGHAILTGETLIGNEPFGVILADDLCVGKNLGVIAQMVRIYEKYRCSILAIEEVDPQEAHKYGVIAGSELDDNIYMVSSMVEKPAPGEAPSNLAIIGRYILTPDIFDILRRTPPGKNGELQITDALQTQANEGMVLAYRFDGQRFDCGSFEGFVEATNYFFNKRQHGD
jgi:UTP--glucose-1-phosphate uridylyltransferase